MSHSNFDVSAPSSARLATGARAEFIANTYIHLLGAIFGFVFFEVALFALGVPAKMLAFVAGNQYGWLLILGGFILVGNLASGAAHRARSRSTQYAALAGFVLAEALIFAPILLLAEYKAAGVIQSAAVVTLLGFIGLTGVAFITRKDFSFLGALLRWIGVAVMIGIVSSLIFGVHLGTWFSVGMIVFAGAAILYQTSNILHHYPEDRYVAASLELFSSVALMFFYVLRLFMSRD